MSLRTFVLSRCLLLCLSLLSLPLSVPWLNSTSCSFFLTLCASSFCVFPSPFSLTFFLSPLHGSAFLPASLCISRNLLNLCSLCHPFLFPVSPCLPFSSSRDCGLYWGDKIDRCLPCSLLSQTVHVSVSRKALELTRWVQSSKNSQEKLHFPEDLEQIWVRRGMIFVEQALWSFQLKAQLKSFSDNALKVFCLWKVVTVWKCGTSTEHREEQWVCSFQAL